MQKKKGFFVLLFSLFVVSFFASWYRQKGEEKLLICGSTCMERLCQVLAEEYMLRCPGVRVGVEIGGSTMGIAGAAEGRNDLASSSRELTEQESARVRAVPIAYDRIAVIVHPENPVQVLSAEELSAVYTGEITDWSQLGWERRPIVVIGRETGSGIRATFEESLLGEVQPVYSQELLENGMVCTAVSVTPGAIGYLSSAYLDESVRPVAVDEEGEDRGALFRLAYYLCVSRDREQKEAERFLSFVLSEEGQQIVRRMGYDGAEAAP